MTRGVGKEFPLISCVMPTYGRPRLVPEAVECFLRQDYPNRELILLNDCPGQILECETPGVRVINAPQRFRTLGEKRNASIEAARGEIIAVWDDDDISLPWRLSFSYGEMQRHGTPFYRPAEFCAYWGTEELHDNQAVRGWLSHGAATFTKRLWEEVDGYRPMGVGEDADFFRRIHATLGQEFIKYPIARSDRFYVMRGTSPYRHMSINGGTSAPDTRAGRISVNPRDIEDPVLREACRELIARRGIHHPNFPRGDGPHSAPVLSVCMALKNRSRTVHQHRLLDLFPRCVRSLSDAATELGPVELVVADFCSTDWPLKEWLHDGGNLSVRIVPLEGDFSRGRGLNAAARASRSRRLFLCDADMIVGIQTLQNGIAAIDSGRASFPVCRLLALNGQSDGWATSTYGLAFLSKEVWAAVGGVPEFLSWGGEGSLLHDRVKSHVPVVRLCEPELQHQWHPQSWRHLHYRRPPRTDYYAETRSTSHPRPLADSPIATFSIRDRRGARSGRTIELFPDGRLRSTDVDSGTYELNGRRLSLRWEGHPAEDLLWNDLAQNFQHVTPGSTLVMESRETPEALWLKLRQIALEGSGASPQTVRRLVIGLGTGRCGTVSLARLLNQQPAWRITHERLAGAISWSGSESVIGDQVRNWMTREAHQVVGDVASYYLPYCRQILDAHPDTRFICLERPRALVIDSFMRKTVGRNHWQPHSGDGAWRLAPVYDRFFPKYPSATDKRHAIGLYWDDYRREAQVLQSELRGQFRIYPTDVLNDESLQQELLSFAGVPQAEQRIEVGIRLNRSR